MVQRIGGARLVALALIASALVVISSGTAGATTETFAYTVGTAVYGDADVEGEGNLEDATAQDVYTFAGAAGQTVALRQLCDTVGTRFPVHFALSAPGGAQVHSAEGTCEPVFIDLPASGTYSLKADSAAGEIGAYSFRMDLVFSYSIGSVVSDGVPAAGAGNLEQADSQDIYTFTGVAGQHLSLKPLSFSGSYGSPNRWTLSTADGTQLFQQYISNTPVEVTLPSSQSYTLVVDNFDTGEPSTYSFAIYWNATVHGTVTELANGAAVPDAFVYGCSHGVCDGYFTGTDGTYSIQVPSGDINVEVQGYWGVQATTTIAGGASGTLDFKVGPQVPTPMPPGATIDQGGRVQTGGVAGVYWSSPFHVGIDDVANTTPTIRLVNFDGTPLPVDWASTPDRVTGPNGSADPPGGGNWCTKVGAKWSCAVPTLHPYHGEAVIVITYLNTATLAVTTQVKFSLYIDPSGVVKDTTGAPLVGATVVLYRSDSSTGPFVQVPGGSTTMSPSNRTNPDTTDSAGHFGWDVLAGFYKVRASKPGCSKPGEPSTPYVETAVMAIPPPVDDIDLRLSCDSSDAGFLRVSTSPSLPSLISVDGQQRDEYGLNWVSFAPGAHEVCFGPVEGYAPPSCQTVSVATGVTTTVTGTFTQLGYLHATTSPAFPSTISVDGVDTNEYGAWISTTAGAHTVCFGAVKDYSSPACRLVTVPAGTTATTVGTFTSSPGAAGPAPGFGLLRVATSPAVGATIIVDGTNRDNWGLNWLKIAPGAHQVCFSALAQASGPGCQTVTVSAGTTATVTGSFIPRGALRAITSPSVNATISIDGVVANNYGAWRAIETGDHNVCFGPAAGHTAPACRTVTVVAGTTATTTGAYT